METDIILKEFQEHQDLYGYPSSLPAYETGKPDSTIRGYLSGRNNKPSVKNLKAIRVFLEAFNKDEEKILSLNKVDLMHEGIRLLHLGEKIEETFEELYIVTIADLVKMTKAEFKNSSGLRDSVINVIENKLKDCGFGFGYNTAELLGSNEKTYKFEIEAYGSPDDALLAFNNIARYISGRLNTKVSLRYKGTDFLPNSTAVGNASLERYPFQSNIVFKSGTRKMEILNKKFRSTADMADLLEEAARKLRSVKTIKDWENSDLWALKW